MADTSIPQQDYDEGEWEYEYDLHQTEEFYIGLDLTDTLPPVVPKKTAKGRKRGSGKRQTATPRKKSTKVKEANEEESDDSTSAEERPKPQFDAQGRQIISLANEGTACPIVMVNGETFQCHWASSIGTDMYFRPAPSDSQTPSYELLAATPLRLVAQPSELQLRDEPLPALIATAASADNDQEESAQPTFLSRLASIKHARGDTDEVPLTQLNMSKIKPASPSSKPPRGGNDAAESVPMDVDQGPPASS